MTRLFWPLFAAAALHAGVMDFQTLSQAKSAYDQGDYNAAAEHYGALQDKNQQALYDYGNALYRAKDYAQAADAFRRIDDPALKPQALHNLGNSLANEGKTDEAIKAYEASLKLKEDEETRFNLDLLKRQQEQQKKDNKQDQQQNDQKDKQDQEKQQDQKQQNSEDKSKEQNQNDQKQQQSNSKEGENASGQSQQGHSSSQNEAEQQKETRGAAQSSESRENEEEPKAAQSEAQMAEPISDMEERKYNKILDKRGIKTLMIPLESKGEPRNDETTPW